MTDKPRHDGGDEITVEMLEAGVEIFCAADLNFERPEDVVTDIYRAMILRQRLVGEGDAPQDA